MKRFPWITTRRETVYETRVFSLRRDEKYRAHSPDDKHDFYVLDAVDWCNVVPVTPEGEIVFIEIHRHGTDGTSLEIPGGMIDPEDASPLEAAAREMREETGYEGELDYLGVVHPNPALQGNRCFSYVAKNARVVGEPRLDETEDIRIARYPHTDVPGLLRDGKITHALVVAALLWFYQAEGAF